MRPTTVQRSGGRPRRLFAALAAPLLALPLLAATATSGASATPLAAASSDAAAASSDGPAAISDVTKWVEAEQDVAEQDLFEPQPGFGPDGEGLSVAPDPAGEVPGAGASAAAVSNPGAVANCGVTERVSVTPDGTQADWWGSGGYKAVNADGRFVAFSSGAANLVEGDTNGINDVLLRDRETGLIERVSVASDGSEARTVGGETPPHVASRGMSADGQVIAFATGAGNLVEGDTNGRNDVFVRDREAGTTERVSVSSDGTQSSALSTGGSVSADGRFVAFSSWGDYLVPGVSGMQVYVRDREAGTTELVSVSSDGTPGSGGGVWYSTGTDWISADGRFVAFFTDHGGLVPGDKPGTVDAFVHDRETGKTERLSVATDGTPGNSGSGYVRMSDDGRYAVFMSYATNLDPVTGSGVNIYLRDRVAGTTRRVSVASDGTPGDRGSIEPMISGDGRFVSFTSYASNLAPGEIRAGQIYVHDQISGVTTRVSVSPSPDCVPGIRSSGGPGSNGGPRISADGSTVVFDTYAWNLVSGDTNGNNDVFTHTLPDLHVSLTSLDFGPVLAGQSRTLSATVTNFSSDEVTVSGVAGPDGPFSLGGSCGVAPFTLASAEQCELAVEFSPTGAGEVSGELSLTTEGSDESYTVDLEGVGSDQPVHVGPKPLDLGGVVAGETGSKRVTVTNATDTAVEVTEVGEPAAPFAAADGSCDQAPFTLKPYASCTLGYRFEPTEVGDAASEVQIRSDAAASPHSFGLRGKGLLRDIAVGPGALDFGDMPIGETSDPQSVTVTNTGEVDARLDEVAEPGKGFTLTGFTCQTVLTPGEKCTLEYTYSPAGPGEATATVSIGSDAASSPSTIRLRGNGTGVSQDALVFDPGELDFGVVEPGATTRPQTATLRNTGTTAVTGLEFAEPGNGFAADTSACGVRLAPDASCEVRVTFAPTDSDTAAGLLRVSSTQGVTGGLGLTGQRGGNAWPEAAKLAADGGRTGDRAGQSTAVDGDTAVVGAPFSQQGNPRGAAYVFVRGDDGGWEQQATLTTPDGEPPALYGYDVAVSGDTVLVAAPGSGPDVHAAYVYTRSDGDWSFQAKLTTSDPRSQTFAGGVFGSPVLAVDGDTAMIGDPLAMVEHSMRGAVYVFTRSDGVWTEQPRLTASDWKTDGHGFTGFGQTVALENGTAVIGQYGALNRFDGDREPGAAYVFTRDQRGGWTERAKLSASDASMKDGFGLAVGYHDGTAVVGAGAVDAAYVFTGAGGAWTEQAKLTGRDNDLSGVSVAVEGDTVLVGAPGTDDGGRNSGSVYAFTRYGGPWNKTAEITAADPTAGAFFGIAADISGGAALIGSENAAVGNATPGAGYVFDPGALPTEGKIALSASGRTEQGKRSVYLSWQGAESDRMDVFRDGELLGTVNNPGFYVDPVGGSGQARFVYQVCEAGTDICSNEAAVTFGGSGG